VTDDPGLTDDPEVTGDPGLTAARPVLAALTLADPPDRWRALGFAVGVDGRFVLGGVELASGRPGHGITGWEVRGAPGLDIALGLDRAPGTTTHPGPLPADIPAPHPNGATGLDHVVVIVPDFDATATRLEQIGLPFRRVRQASETVRQGFRRLGPAILEVVETPGAGAAAFWGLVVIVPDLDAPRAVGAPHVKPPRPAVQPGRQIAPVGRSAGLTTQLAFMDPEPSAPA
jgi:hypothetical protein